MGMWDVNGASKSSRRPCNVYMANIVRVTGTSSTLNYPSLSVQGGHSSRMTLYKSGERLTHGTPSP